MTDTHSNAAAAIDQLARGRERVLAEIQKVIVGQTHVVDELLVALFAGGHCLLVGVPGLAKTLLISTTAKALSLSFSRIQFTPDLMPTDITGTHILEEDSSTGRRFLKFIEGPVFANVILADEINRTPPKTQAALLQAMQEKEVTSGSETRQLELPFFVLATQNPIEMEGTYPLPEAQLDRFMFNIRLDYPSEAEEVEIVRRTTGALEAKVVSVLTREEILGFQSLVRRVPVSDYIMEYAVSLVAATRPTATPHDFVRSYVAWGAGPRASQYLVLGAKTRAALRGQPTPTVDDVKAVAPAVLRHRIVNNFNADAEGITTDQLISRLVAAAPVHAGRGA
jgi:MoxR-like ATPase